MAETHNETVDIFDRVDVQTPQGSPTVEIGQQETNAHKVHYHVSAHKASTRGALVDRGANGGILGSDAHVAFTHVNRRVDVTGIDNHELTALKIVDATAKVVTQYGPVILIMHQYAYHGTGRTIHAPVQLEHFGHTVYDRSLKTKHGGQAILTREGYVIPLDIIKGLPYMKMFPHTKKEFDSLPHVVLTSDVTWNPSLLDHHLTDLDDWVTHIPQHIPTDTVINHDSPFDEIGEYKKKEPTYAAEMEPTIDFTEVSLHQLIEDTPFRDIRHTFAAASDLNTVLLHNDKKITNPRPPDYERLRPYFLGVPIEKIRRTFENTTQHAKHVEAGRHLYTRPLNHLFLPTMSGVATNPWPLIPSLLNSLPLITAL